MPYRPAGHWKHISLLCAYLCVASTTIFEPANGYGQTTAKKVVVSEQLVTGVLSAGMFDEYEIDLTAGQHFYGKILKRDFNLLLSIYDPDGKRAAAFISRRYEPLSISHYVEKSGKHTIEVRSIENEPEPQSYQLWINKPVVASARELKITSAMQHLAKAAMLRAEWKEESLQLAVTEYVTASEIWRTLGRNEDEVKALLNAGEACFVLSQMSRSQDFYKQAVVVSQENNDWQSELDALDHLGHVSIYLSAHQKTKELAEKVLNFYQERSSATTDDDLRLKAQAFSNLGEANYSSGNWKRALELFSQALNLWSSVKDRRGQALAHINMGYTHLDAGNLPQAQFHFEKSLRLFRAIDDRKGEAQSLNAIGGIYSFLGENQKALQLFHQARQHMRACGDRQIEVVTLNWMGKIYEDLNKPDNALDSFKAALGLCQELQDIDCEAVTRYYVGRAYQALGQTEYALTHYRRSLTLGQQNGKRRLEAYVLKELARTYVASGEIQKALAEYEKVLTVYVELEDLRGQAYALISLGDLYNQPGEIRTALNSYQQALKLTQSSQDRAGEVLARFKLAETEKRLGRWEEALSHADRAVEMVESLRTKVAGQDYRMSYFAAASEHYRLYIDLLMYSYEQKPSEDRLMAALKASEKARGRTLLEMLNESKIEIREGIDSVLLEKDRYYRQIMSAKVDRSIRLLSSKSTAQEAAEAEKEIESLNREYQAVQAQIKAVSPQYAALKQPEPLEVKEIQRQVLDPNTALLEYSLGEEKSFLWVVTQTSIDYFKLPNRYVIETAARKVYDSLTARYLYKENETRQQRLQRIQDADREYHKLAAALSEMVLVRAMPLLGKKRLIIVADGALRYIPFAALPISGARNSDDSKAKPLLMDHEIIYLPSASIMPTLRDQIARRKPAQKLLVVVSDPVFDENDERVGSSRSRPAARAKGEDAPRYGIDESLDQAVRDVRPDKGGTLPRLLFSKQEGEEILKLAPKDSTLATGFEANKELVTSPKLGEYGIVHFATHGLVNSKNPELSGVVLSLVDEQGRQREGFLRLQEMYNLKLSADLVVLSACSTALGEEIQGEGLVGLTRGFLYAGAARVVASLWNVTDEATAELMKRFYKSMLKDGMAAPAALRAAQLDMLKSRDWSEPHHWSAFIMEGEWK